jgi:ElaB/YqjD/DUF883 family membrane-anchored ribosome-binding protein
MDKKPDQIERDIREYRDQVSGRLVGLRTRARNDVDKIRSEARSRTSGGVESAKGALNSDGIRGLMQEHTVSMIAGAVGVGVLLGVASEGIGGGGGSGSNDSEQNGRSNNSQSDAGGGLISMLSSFISPAASTAQEELQDLIREGFATLKEQVRPGGNESRTAGEPAALKEEVRREGNERRPGAEAGQ